MPGSGSNAYPPTTTTTAAGAASSPAATTTTTTTAAAALSPAVSTGSTCDACYRRKSRCAMNESVNKCYSCDFHRQDCTFTYSTQMQAPPQSQLGKRKFHDEFGGVDEGQGEVVAKRPAPERPSSPMSGASALPDSLLRGTPLLHPHPHSHSHLHPISPPEDPFLTSQHIGLTTELEPLLLDYLSLDHNSESPLATSRVRKFADDGTFMRMIDGSHVRLELHTVSIEAIENLVAPFGPTLVDKFFQHVHPTFPVLMEDAFRHAYQTRRNLSPVLLAAVYFVALKWLDPAAIGAGAAAHLRRPDATRLEAMATRLLNESLARAHISTIQAGLLLSQKSPLNTPTLIAQLVTVGFDLGLHQDCSAWKIGAWERGLRKRIAWALYVQDKWCALVHGRPSHIFKANWTVRELDAVDFTDAYSTRSNSNSMNNNNVDGGEAEEAPPGSLLFRRFVTLTAILSDILDTFYTLQAAADFSAAGAQRTRIILERAKPIQIRLKDWFTRLPEELKMDHHGGNLHPQQQQYTTYNSIIPDTPNFNGTLHLAYFATEITLHRTIIRSLTPSTADPYLSHICRSAAKTRLISAMDFVNRLRPTHLRSFWPSASRTNFALISSFGILLRATAVTREEEEFYRLRLGEYRWTLSVSCKDAEFLVSAIEGLDVGMCLLRNVPGKRGLEEIMVEKGRGGRQQQRSMGVGMGMPMGATADDPIAIGIAEDEDEDNLDVDPELEEEMEMEMEMEEIAHSGKRMAHANDVDPDEDIYSFSSAEYEDEYPHPNSKPQPQPQPHHHPDDDDDGDGDGGGSMRGQSVRVRKPSQQQQQQRQTSKTQHASRPSTATATATGVNQNQNQSRNRNPNATATSATAPTTAGGDGRAGSLPSVVSGLASPATSLEGRG
ncbi:hypothetical protein FQN50_008006 [Emmonsiellopsis sp. PD_5]|nr:hypothetical protein FQN50_008006 [Emmonsiellopsis sp. PD_5]